MQRLEDKTLYIHGERKNQSFASMQVMQIHENNLAAKALENISLK